MSYVPALSQAVTYSPVKPAYEAQLTMNNNSPFTMSMKNVAARLSSAADNLNRLGGSLSNPRQLQNIVQLTQDLFVPLSQDLGNLQKIMVNVV